MHIDNREHKIEGKNVLYWNGVKWLVREFCKTKKDAEDLIKLKRVKDKKDAK